MDLLVTFIIKRVFTGISSAGEETEQYSPTFSEGKQMILDALSRLTDLLSLVFFRMQMGVLFKLEAQQYLLGLCNKMGGISF